jgi:glutathione S-transferase
MPTPRYAIWGSELSPFSLKLRALCDYARIDYEWLPDHGGRLHTYRIAWTIEKAKRKRAIARHPRMDELDEYPLVPFFVDSGRQVSYDSSALARWMDEHHRAATGPFFPHDPALAFVARLVDEAFDEYGLYMVHHNRWVVSGGTNDAGQRLAREFRHVILPGMARRFAAHFARRQVRRLPYLFSVAPERVTLPGLPAELTPPSRSGFPGTHALLDESWHQYLSAMETVLGQQAYLLGDRFTVADASAHGELGMNLKDPTAAATMQERAPLTYAWLCRIRAGEHVGSDGPLRLSDELAALLDVICRTFVPLMRQNEVAYDAALREGETLFNEAAFDRHRALYDGELLGRPFRSVAKSFQVRVWRDLRAAWQALPDESRKRLAAILPATAQADLSVPTRTR